MKLPYFKLNDAFNEARETFSTGARTPDKMMATAKLVGKTVANIGMLAADASVELAKRAPEIAGSMANQSLAKNSHRMSAEQIERAKEIARHGDEARERRLAREQEEAEKNDKAA